MARKNLHEAMLKTAKGESPEEPVKEEEGAPPPKKPKKVKPALVNVTGYFPPEVKSSLRLIQAQTGRTIQDILAEALNDVFAKYHVPETAPRN